MASLPKQLGVLNPPERRDEAPGAGFRALCAAPPYTGVASKKSTRTRTHIPTHARTSSGPSCKVNVTRFLPSRPVKTEPQDLRPNLRVMIKRPQNSDPPRKVGLGQKFCEPTSSFEFLSSYGRKKTPPFTGIAP
jgi:hypothetical protein